MFQRFRKYLRRQRLLKIISDIEFRLQPKYRLEAGGRSLCLRSTTGTGICHYFSIRDDLSIELVSIWSKRMSWKGTHIRCLEWAPDTADVLFNFANRTIRDDEWYVD